MAHLPVEMIYPNSIRDIDIETFSLIGKHKEIYTTPLI